MTDTKTPEQIAEDKRLAAELKAAEKKALADAKALKKAEDKAAADKLREEKAAKKAEEKALKDAEKLKAAEANKMPEQNGVRRPKPATACGRCWALFDQISGETGAPATISAAMALAGDLNEDTVRTQYARWRKFHGVVGRLVDPAAEAAKAAKVLADAEAKEVKRLEREAKKVADAEAKALKKADADAKKLAETPAE